MHLRYDGDVTCGCSDAGRCARRRSRRSLAPLRDKPDRQRAGPVARGLKQLEAIEPRTFTFIRTPRSSFSSGCTTSGSAAHGGESAAIRRSIRCESLLKIPLLPYQLDGIAFAVGAGGPCWPTTWAWAKRFKASAWRNCWPARPAFARCWSSARRRSSRSGGTKFTASATATCNSSPARSRSARAQYANDCFFTICNYEQVLRDILSIEQTPWDLIILDEGQRIKNWEAKTSRVIKGLRSRFALVLSGTPLENRLDELYSVVQFIDDRRLGPGFRFFNQHRIVDEKGKVLGYKNLDELRERLQPILLRRTRDSVQAGAAAADDRNRPHPADRRAKANCTTRTCRSSRQIVRKKFITEMDLLRLRMALLMCRMSANSTFLVHQGEPELFEQAGTAGRTVRRPAPTRPTARSCSSPNGRRCST